MGSLIAGVWQDFRTGLRSLRKDLRLSLLAVATLSLGIGSVTIIFSILDNVLLSPFAYKNAGRLATVYEHFASGLLDRDSFSPEEFVDFRKQNHSFADMVAVSPLEVLFTGTEGTQQTWGAWTSPELFDVLGTKPFLGRDFAASDGEPGAPPVFAITYRLWTEQFGQDRKIIGKAFTLNGSRRTLIAVMPGRFRLFDLDIWMPLNVYPDTSVLGAANVRAHFMALGHLKPGATLKSGTSDLDVILQAYEKEHPGNYPERITILLKSFTDAQVGNTRGLLLALTAAVTMLLLISCSNVANLLLVRATVREKEIAVRAALGAGRARLVRQFLVESLLLGLGGCMSGCVLAYLGLKGVVAVMPVDAIPSEITIQMNPLVIGFSLGAAFLTALLCGLAPALRAGSKNLFQALTSIGKGATAGFRQVKFRDVLVVVEVSFSIVLLTGAGLMMRSIAALRHVDLGFEPAHLLWMRITLPQGRYEKAEEKKAFFENALVRLAAIPGVTAAAESYAPPSCCAAPSVLAIESKKPTGTWYVRYEPVSADYFQALQTPLLHGRLLTQNEISSARRVAVVNRSMVRAYFPSGDAVGQKIEFSSFDTAADYPHNAWFEIVGVVGDVKNVSVRSAVMPEAYIPYTSFGRTSRSLLVRSVGDPLSLLPQIRREIWTVEPGAAVSRTISMQELLKKNTYAEPLFGLFVLVSFAGIGLLLVVVGVFSVMAYTVSLHTHEIGVRMALGAQRNQLLSMVLIKGTRIILAGIAIGLLASYGFARVAASQFWGVGPADAFTFSAVALVLLFVALLACLLPAQRAMNVDPLIAMRYE